MSDQTTPDPRDVALRAVLENSEAQFYLPAAIIDQCRAALGAPRATITVTRPIFVDAPRVPHPDTARLDWIEASDLTVPITRLPTYQTWESRVPTSAHGIRVFEADTARAAIDAAMAAEGDPKP